MGKLAYCYFFPIQVKEHALPRFSSIAPQYYVAYLIYGGVGDAFTDVLIHPSTLRNRDASIQRVALSNIVSPLSLLLSTALGMTHI